MKESIIQEAKAIIERHLSKDARKFARSVLRFFGEKIPARYGCFLDVKNPYGLPDDCVIYDDRNRKYCKIAGIINKKEDCEYWREIK